jgi:hypothetical protein
MDAADWTGVGELFADAELVAENGAVVAAGADAVRAMYERGTKLYNGLPHTRHITANSIVDIDGNSATARSCYVVFQQAGGLVLQPIITGRYRGRFTSHE